MQQFRIISELGCFKDTPFIVFLNKIDLLPEKLRRAPLSRVFKDFDAFVQQESLPNDEVEKAVAYFEGKLNFTFVFLTLLATYNKHFKADFVEYHTTCALDKDSCIKVFESMQRSLIQRSFNATSIM